MLQISQRIAIWPQRRAPSVCFGKPACLVTVFRCTHIIGPPSSPGPTAASLLATGKNSVTVLGNGKQRVAPVYLGDVVTAIEAAISSGKAGTFDLQGPEEMSIDDLVRRLNGPAKVSIAHVPAVLARLFRFVGPNYRGR